jgi:hypothetical protein
MYGLKPSFRMEFSVMSVVRSNVGREARTMHHRDLGYLEHKAMKVSSSQ